LVLFGSSSTAAPVIVKTFFRENFEGATAPWAYPTKPWIHSPTGWSWGEAGSFAPPFMNPPSVGTKLAASIGCSTCTAAPAAITTPDIPITIDFPGTDYKISFEFDYNLNNQGPLQIFDVSIDDGTGFATVFQGYDTGTDWSTFPADFAGREGQTIKLRFTNDYGGDTTGGVLGLDNVVIYAYNTSCWNEQPSGGCSSQCVTDCVCSGTGNSGGAAAAQPDCCDLSWDQGCATAARAGQCDVFCGIEFPPTATHDPPATTTEKETTAPATTKPAATTQPGTTMNPTTGPPEDTTPTNTYELQTEENRTEQNRPPPSKTSAASSLGASGVLMLAAAAVIAFWM